MLDATGEPIWLLRNVIAGLLLPPANGLLLVAAGVLLHRRPWLGRALAVAGLLLLAGLSTKPVAQALLAPLEREAGLLSVAERHSLGGAQAIVVVGGGRHRDAPELVADTVSERTLVRLRYAALLAREARLPVLVSGGAPEGGARSEAEAMAEVLAEWGVVVRWQETASADTAHNARRSAALLREAGVSRVALVTHAAHLPRARRAFEAAGIAVVSAPTGFHANEPLTLRDWLPQAEGLRLSRAALHEWLGRLWYAR